MKRFIKRIKKAEKWASTIAPRMKKELDAICEQSKKLSVKPSGDTVFQVKDMFYTPMKWFIVEIEGKTCDCGFWEMLRYLCRHQ